MRRRFVRSIAFLVYAWLVVELGAWCGLWLFQGHRPSWSQQATRQRQSLEAAAGMAEGATEDGPSAPRRVAFATPHPYVGFVPGTARTNPAAGFTGLCDAPLGDPDAPCYADETFVVGLAGGSVAANLASSQLELYERELAAHPAAAGREVFFVRFAIPGYKQPQQLSALAYLYSLGVRFDLVVNLDGFNEIALHARSNAPSGVFAAYPRDWYTRHHVRGDLELFASTSYVSRRRAELAQEILNSPLRYSFVWQLAWARADRDLSQRYETLVGAAKADPEPAAQRTPGTRDALLGPPRRYATDAAMYADLVAIWRRSALQMHALCAANGARYVHFLQPNQYLPGSKPLSAEELATAYDRDSPFRPAVEGAYPGLIAAGAELADAGVRFFDLTALFAEVEETVYRDDCCHFNATGNNQLARAIAAAMLESL